MPAKKPIAPKAAAMKNRRPSGVRSAPLRMDLRLSLPVMINEIRLIAANTPMAMSSMFIPIKYHELECSLGFGIEKAGAFGAGLPFD